MTPPSRKTDLLGNTFSAKEACALEMDARDPLRHYRKQFHIPRHNGKPVIYLCGCSLGLQPQAASAAVEQELEDWARLGVRGHFEGRSPWFPYHEMFRKSAARLVGAVPGEAVLMNGLTVNLHLMLATFYRPTAKRFKILSEEPAFPSDLYAIKSALRLQGRDPSKDLVLVRPREGEHTLRTEDLERTIKTEGDRLALVLLSAVNFLTGQALPIRRITAAAQRQGAYAGWDLAHAAGNVPLSLHDWNVDFAVWCSYKYLNGGPGAVGGCFVHERHGRDRALPRLAGWWGHDPKTRFRLQLAPEFVPQPGAEGWQLSNPPILSMAPLKASLALFDRAGMPALRAKSERLTAYLETLINDIPEGQPMANFRRLEQAVISRNRVDQKQEQFQTRYKIITPRDPAARGCQLSILVHDRARELHRNLEGQGIVCDFREPNVIRTAPVPLYNSFHDVWKFAQALARHGTHGLGLVNVLRT